MELTGELRSPQVGEINDGRRKRFCRDAEQLSRGERRDVDSESASTAGVSDQRRSRMQPTYEAAEGAGGSVASGIEMISVGSPRLNRKVRAREGRPR